MLELLVAFFSLMGMFSFYYLQREMSRSQIMPPFGNLFHTQGIDYSKIVFKSLRNTLVLTLITYVIHHFVLYVLATFGQNLLGL